MDWVGDRASARDRYFQTQLFERSCLRWDKLGGSHRNDKFGSETNARIMN